MPYNLDSHQTFDFSGINAEPISFTADKSKKKKKSFEMPGMIYALKVGDRIKLGRTTTNISKRLNQYIRVNPETYIIAIRNEKDCFVAEKKLCKHFGCTSCRNEWLEYDKGKEKEIKDYFCYLN